MALWARTFELVSVCVQQGYYLGPAQMQFEIVVEVTTLSMGTNTTQSLTITPSTPTALSEGYNVSAQLLGDLASYSASPDFEYSMLMIPSPTGALKDCTCLSEKLRIGAQYLQHQWTFPSIGLRTLRASSPRC